MSIRDLSTLGDTTVAGQRAAPGEIAFPALGTGVGGVPHGLLPLEAIRTLAAFLPTYCRSIRIALHSPETVAAWTTTLVAFDADAVPT